MSVLHGFSQTDTLTVNSEDTSVVKDDIEDRVFTRVDKKATFSGGYTGWRDYLMKHLKADVATKAGAPAGIYTVKVQFIVNVKGKVGEVKVVDAPPFCAACSVEAVRVITNSPRWKPAEQNGRKVKYMAIQSVSFVVEEDEPKRKKGN